MRFLMLALVVFGVSGEVAAQRLSQRELHLRLHRARSRALEADDVAGRLELARWCESKGLEAQARREARRVIARDPANAAARGLVGEILFNGQWMKRDEVMPRLGYRRYRGEWHLPARIEELEREEAEKRRRQKVIRTARAEYRALASPSAARRRRARDRLLAIASREKLPDLAEQTKRVFAHYDRALTRGRGVVEVRAQLQGPTTFRRFTTSLGQGTGVTLELPRSRRVSVGTTVGF